MTEEQFSAFVAWLMERYASAQQDSELSHGAQEGGEANAFGEVLKYLKNLIG